MGDETDIYSQTCGNWVEMNSVNETFPTGVSDKIGQLFWAD